MESFSSFDIFQWLPPEAQRAFAQRAQVRKFNNGQLVYTQGDYGDEMYRIVSGSVRVSGIKADGRELLYLVFEAGDCFGASSLIDGEPRLQNAEAGGTTQLQVMNRAGLYKLREDYPAFNEAILRLVNAQLRLLADYFASSHLDEMSDRLLQRILDTASVAGVACKDGIMLSRRLSQAELALMVGASRQSVNKVLRGFQDQGLFTLRYGTLIIHDIEKLQALRRNSWRQRRTVSEVTAASEKT